ncbi:glycosyltransferase family 4 protein [Methanococcoides sp. SA1]|nr:glycosyltransferase family 4 protein [Methanococcoides sp. SA1]
MNSNNNKNVCMIAYRPLPKFFNRLKIAKGVKKAGFDVDYICPMERDQLRNETISGINVIRTNDIFGEWSSYIHLLYNYISFSTRVFLFILKSKKKYGYYHIHNPPDFLMFPIILFKLIYGSKIVLDLHDMFPESVQSNLNSKFSSIYVGIAKTIEKIAIYFSDAIICTNEYDKEIVLSRNNISSNQIFTIMNVPNPDECTIEVSDKKSFGLGDKFIVLFEGTIWKRRGIQSVIDAVNLLKDKIPIHFLVVGDGPDKDDLEKVALDTSLADVSFSGWVDPSLLSKYISISDVCVIPFLKTKVNNRGVPNKLFEYTMHDKPIIASRLEGMSRVFNDDEVVYFEPGNAEDIASKILWIYNNPNDAAIFAKKAKKHYLADYTWDKMELELSKCYESLS